MAKKYVKVLFRPYFTIFSPNQRFSGCLDRQGGHPICSLCLLHRGRGALLCPASPARGWRHVKSPGFRYWTDPWLGWFGGFLSHGGTEEYEMEHPTKKWMIQRYLLVSETPQFVVWLGWFFWGYIGGNMRNPPLKPPNKRPLTCWDHASLDQRAVRCGCAAWCQRWRGSVSARRSRRVCLQIGKYLWWFNIAIENGHLQLIFQLKMVIFHSYVSLPEGIRCLEQFQWEKLW